MFRQSLKSIAGRALLGSVLWAAVSLPAFATPADYRFEAIKPQVEASWLASIAVRLIHTPSGNAVTGADLSVAQPRFDMPMLPRGPMTSWVSAVQEPAPGTYVMNADLSMEGDWLLTLNANVPGEQEPIRSTIPIKVLSSKRGHWSWGGQGWR